MAMSLKLLRPSGMAGFVTPTSFMSGRHFCKLRRHLMENTHIANIGIVSARLGVFIDVEQETALTIFKRREPKQKIQTTTKKTKKTKKNHNTTDRNNENPNNGSVW